MSAPVLSALSGNLTKNMQGVWWLQSREDWTNDGQRRIDPTLGSDPIGILTYAPSHFAAQFMKRNRLENLPAEVAYASKNNSSAVGGYDAYFGTYEVNEQTGDVAHTLIGSLATANIGLTFLRTLRVNNDQLMLQLATTTPGGEPVTRTLVWKRIG